MSTGRLTANICKSRIEISKINKTVVRCKLNNIEWASHYDIRNKKGNYKHSSSGVRPIKVFQDFEHKNHIDLLPYKNREN